MAGPTLELGCSISQLTAASTPQLWLRNAAILACSSSNPCKAIVPWLSFSLVGDGDDLTEDVDPAPCLTDNPNPQSSDLGQRYRHAIIFEKMLGAPCPVL